MGAPHSLVAGGGGEADRRGRAGGQTGTRAEHRLPWPPAAYPGRPPSTLPPWKGRGGREEGPPPTPYPIPDTLNPYPPTPPPRPRPPAAGDAPTSVAAAVSADPNLSTLLAAVKAANWTAWLSDPNKVRGRAWWALLVGGACWPAHYWRRNFR